VDGLAFSFGTQAFQGDDMQESMTKQQLIDGYLEYEETIYPERGEPDLAYCRRHYVGILCARCPYCVGCRRQFSSTAQHASHLPWTQASS
jgi:hypothetical protein